MLQCFTTAAMYSASYLLQYAECTMRMLFFIYLSKATYLWFSHADAHQIRVFYILDLWHVNDLQFGVKLVIILLKFCDRQELLQIHYSYLLEAQFITFWHTNRKHLCANHVQFSMQITLWWNKRKYQTRKYQRHVNTERSICANCGGRKPAQSAKDGQRNTMHNTVRYMITM